MLVMTCPKCERTVTAADDKRGERVVCEACGQKIKAANQVTPRTGGSSVVAVCYRTTMANMNLDISSQEAGNFAKELEQARNELLDLSFRNRALSLRPDSKSSRILKIVNAERLLRL